MKMLSITALASWVRCPRSFYVSYVLKIRPQLNKAMAMGSTKHKVHELWANIERKVAYSLLDLPIDEAFDSEAVGVAQLAVRTQARSLKRVGVPLTEAFQGALAIAKNSAKVSANRFRNLVDKGLKGDGLWDALTPKLKCEYSIKCERLGFRGRIDTLELYDGKLVPVELKSGRTPDKGVFAHHRMQATCYAVALEEMFETSVPIAIIHYLDGGVRREIVLNPFMRAEIERVNKECRECLESKEVPTGCDKGYCDACKIVRAMT